MVIVFFAINIELFIMLFIIVVLLCLNNQHRNTIVVYVIDNTIVCGDMARIGNVVTAHQCLRMSKASTYVDAP